MQPDTKKALEAIYNLVNTRHKELITHIDKKHELLHVKLEQEVNALRKNLKEEVEKLETRFNITETEIEAVIGTAEFQEVIGKRLEAAAKELKVDDTATDTSE